MPDTEERSDRELLRYLQGELRALERMLDKPVPLASHAEKQAALRAVREMRDRVYAASISKEESRG